MNSITVTVNNKDFIVNPPKAYETLNHGFVVAYSYWSTRNGAAFGPIRTATEQLGKPTSVGVQIAAAARTAFGIDNDAMITEVSK